MTETPAVAEARPRRRIPLWDNARFAAIVFVVLGHALLPLRGETDTAQALYYAIYLFHVPAFVMISGYFAKASPPGPKGLRRLLTDLVLPYLFFEIVWTLIHWWIDGKLSLDLATPSWTLWFLLALAIWRVILPYVAMLRFPLAISILISVGAGYLPSIGDTFALNRTLSLLPFFVLGWKLKQWGLLDRWNDARRGVIPIRIAAGAAFAIAFVVIVVFLPTWKDLHLGLFQTFRDAYPSFGYDQWWAGIWRLALIVVAGILCLAFLVLAPRSRTPYSKLGAATLYIYLLHTFVLYPLRETSALTDLPTWTQLPVVIAVAIAIPLVFSTTIVRTVFRPVIEPRALWLFTRSKSALRSVSGVVEPPK